MMPLISIIVPVYNVEKYLNECVMSLVNQTYKKIQILLIDDGSTDRSGDLCDELDKKYDNIHTYHKKNSGLGFTRNYGLKRSNGDYVTFVDSDDYLSKYAIQDLVDGLEEGRNDTVIGGFTKVTDKGQSLYIEAYQEKRIKKEKIYNIVFGKMLGSSPNKHDILKPAVWNTLYSMNIIKKYSLSFVSERELISEDIVWDSDYYKYSKSVKIITSVGYYYRFNPVSLSHTYMSNRFEKSIYFFQYMKKKLKGTSLDTDVKLRLIKNLFINVRACFAQDAELSFVKIYSNIKRICNSSILQRSIGRYPINKLGVKQKGFILMVKYKLVFCLALLVKLKIIHE